MARQLPELPIMPAVDVNHPAFHEVAEVTARWNAYRVKAQQRFATEGPFGRLATRVEVHVADNVAHDLITEATAMHRSPEAALNLQDGEYLPD